MIHPHSNLHSPPLVASPQEFWHLLLTRLAKIESSLELLMTRQTIKEWYTTDEAAEILGKAPFTVREWCRNHRIKAAKRDCGRGNSKEWIISREELTRIQTEGLRAQNNAYRHVG
jgi:hypothetical protein